MTTRHILLSNMLATLAIGSALAADLPSQKAPVYVPPPPVLSWTGFYFGANAGGAWSQSGSIASSAVGIINDPAFGTNGLAFGATANGVISNNGGGVFMGGGQGGYNWQFGTGVVAGVETDIQGFLDNFGKGRIIGAGVDPVSGAAPVTMIATNRSFDYLGTVRGRLGYLVMPSLLVFGTGGLAYGGANLSAFYASQDASGLYLLDSGTATFSDLRVGWTAGGGLEWMFWPNWSVKAEYLYFDLGSVSANVFVVDQAAGLWSYGARVSGELKGQLARVGVNYHFNWGASAPVIAKY